MRRSIDILLPTLGVAITGAVTGALCAVLLLAADLLRGGPGNLAREALPYFVIVAYLGAALGAFVAPVIRWSLLRRIALGRALAWTTAGALSGGAIGLVLAHDVSGFEKVELTTVVLTAVAGLVGAAGVLRIRGARAHETP